MSKAIARKEQMDAVRALLERLKPQMEMALPRHLNADRLLRVTMSAVQNTPKLLECDRTSFLAAVMTSAQLGLVPDGVLGQAYLVPFKGKVQFIPGYRGLLTLARNSGEVQSIQAHEVCDNDEFEYCYGLDERLHHRPAEGDRGPVRYYYAYAKFVNGGHVFEVLTQAEVMTIRDKSEGYKAFKAGFIKSTPWVTHEVEMGRKTAIRRLAKYLPLSVQRAAAIEDYYDAGKHAAADEYGGITIDGDAEDVTDDDATDTAKDPTKARLDALAGNGAANPPETPAEEEKPKRRRAAAAKPEETQKKDDEAKLDGEAKPRFVLDGDPNEGAAVLDTQTGELVPDRYVKWFGDGAFSVLQGYFKAKTEEPAAEPEPGNSELGGLFSPEA